MARTALAILGAAALAATAHAAGSVRGAQKGAPDVVAYSGGCTGKSWQFLMMVEVGALHLRTATRQGCIPPRFPALAAMVPHSVQ